MDRNLIEELIIDFSNFIWGTPLLLLLFLGGLYFLFYSGLKPLKYLKHSVGILSGKYDNPSEPGQINHYQALSTALAGTVGMGNISGVAAIPLGTVSSLGVVISIFDSAYALMAFPNMIAALLLSPHVIRETKKYFKTYEVRKKK